MTTALKHLFEGWVADNCPNVNLYRMSELPPDIKAEWAASFAETFAHETDPDILAAVADLKRRMGIREH